MILENMSTSELFKIVVQSNLSIKEAFIHPYPDVVPLEQRIHFNKLEQLHYTNALKLRKRDNVPFWDALMLSFYNQKQFSIEILDNVLNNHQKRKLEIVSRKDILSDRLLDISRDQENYALNSRVTTSEDKIKHLLLLDFHIPQGVENQEVVENILRILETGKGYLLTSGKSYHFLGETLISTATLTKFLGKCLFFSPIIDKSWIGHQLIDRSCSIRITKKYNLFPTFCKRIEA